ncbi:ARM repeat-containing protein [Gonapodya prolifera JEL478]|uniref:ARM repeat-containing protein n=1 Tax=Gonapodya prolifera (strain JEL478) TaxID=1344416 RepID=A0A139AUL6_GONPJ|nr:ARM repeat-containing protein [Gonapodya prolifera JEL478]|eukprot:KXS20408.1 ARM repeat-containing protein [Gonapodya prolifera JEL478]
MNAGSGRAGNDNLGNQRITDNEETRDYEKPEDVLSLDSLAELVDHQNVIVQESVTQILLDRAASYDTLAEVVAACSVSDPVLRESAVNCVALLAKIETAKTPLVRLGALRVLSEVVRDPFERDVVRRDAVIALFKLVSGEDSRRSSLVRLDVLTALSKILVSDPSRSNDLKYWTLLLVHQLCVCDALHPALLATGFVPLLSQHARLSFGNTNTQKLCLHAVVRLVGQAEGAANTESELRKLIDMEVSAFISSCLRSDDPELAYWSLRLLFEFACRDIGRYAFSTQRGVLAGLMRTLGVGEPPAIRVALRTLKWLTSGNEDFQRHTLSTGIVRRLAGFLRSDDGETMTLALALVHELAENVDSHGELFETGCVKRLVELSPSLSVPLALYVADIFVFLCGSAANAMGVVGDGVVGAVVGFCKSNEPDLQYGGVAMLLNLSAIADDAIMLEIISSGGVAECQRLILSDNARRNVRTVSAKALVTMSSRDAGPFRNVILTSVLKPLCSKIVIATAQVIRLLFPPENSLVASVGEVLATGNLNSRDHYLLRIGGVYDRDTIENDSLPQSRLKQTKEAHSTSEGVREAIPLSENLIGMLATLTILANTPVFDNIPSDAGSEILLGVETVLGRVLTDLGSSLLDLVVLPLVDKETANAAGIDMIAISELNEGMTEGDPSHQTSDRRELRPKTSETSFSIQEIARKKLGLSVHSLDVIAQVVKYDTFRDYVVKEKFLSLIAPFIDHFNEQLARAALIALSSCIEKDDNAKWEALQHPRIVAAAWSTHLNRPSLAFFANLFLENALDFSLADGVDYVQLNCWDKTYSLLVSRDHLEIRNESWTFESIRATHGVSHSGQFAFEVELRTDGIIQIGWATRNCRYDPEAGNGIGDDLESYSFDGCRKQKWHGVTTKDNAYGDSWSVGDVITCRIDLDEREISYLQNGRSLGVAFQNVDSDNIWFVYLHAINCCTNGKISLI